MSVEPSVAPGGAPVRPGVALALSATAFVALAIFGLGMTSLLLDRDVIAVEGLGQFPGVLGIVVAVLAFAGVLWPGLRRAHPSYRASLATALAVLIAYVVGVWLGALLGGAELGTAGGAAGGLVTGGFAVVVALAALACALFAIALVRTRSTRPRWPWESDEDS